MTNVKQEGSTTLSTPYTNFTSILKVRMPDIGKVSLVIQNAHATASLNWKVLVSNDPAGATDSFAEEKASAALTATSKARYLITVPAVWIDIQIQSDGADSPQANVWLLGVE